MKALSFLIEREEHEEPPLQARLAERLWIRTLFWCHDTEEHTLDVVSHTPDGTRTTVGRITRACWRAPAVLAMEGQLHPLGIAGWHRLHLILDDRDTALSKPVFVLGPGSSVARYVGRDEPLPEAEPAAPAERPTDVPHKKASNGRDSG